MTPREVEILPRTMKNRPKIQDEEWGKNRSKRKNPLVIENVNYKVLSIIIVSPFDKKKNQ